MTVNARSGVPGAVPYPVTIRARHPELAPIMRYLKLPGEYSLSFDLPTGIRLWEIPESWRFVDFRHAPCERCPIEGDLWAIPQMGTSNGLNRVLPGSADTEDHP